jgi:hypothetical protein
MYKIGDKVTAKLVLNGQRGKFILVKGRIKAVRGTKRKFYTLEDAEVQQEFVVYKVTKSNI